MAAGGHRQSFSSAVWAKLRAGATKAIPQGFRVRHEGFPQVILSNNLLKGWNGSIIQGVTVLVTSDGASWTLSMTGPGTSDIDAIFAGVAHKFDCTPAATIGLTAGTDAILKVNFIYLTESNGVITLNANTTGFPEGTPHAHIATVSLQSLASGQTDGPMRVHVWVDHVDETGEGHVVHLSEKVRNIADHKTGTAASMAVSAPDAFFAVTEGTIYQLHLHTFPARDMATGDKLFLVNDPGRDIANGITTLDDITQDAASGAINNKFLSIVLFGVVSETEADCKIYANLPVGSYVTGAKAVEDLSKFSVYDMPASFAGTAFLIARITVRAFDSGTWVEFDIEDLRGDSPSTSPGGGAGVLDHINLAGLTSGDAGHTQLHTDAKALTWLADGGAEGGQPVSLWEQIKAGFNLTGGGTISMSAGSLFKWTARFIAISNGRGAHFSTAGFFDIIKPDGGILVGVGGASDRTWTTAGIVLNAWEALYYILPIGSDNTSLLANFRVADYRNALEVPADWILLAVRNGDDGIVKVGTGIHLGLGESSTNTGVLLRDGTRAMTGVPPGTPAANSFYKHPNAGGQLATTIDVSSAEAAIAGALDAAQGGISTGALEDWHEIGATDEPAFANSWVNFGAGQVTAAFRKLPTGEVYMKGFLKDGTITSEAFTLPVGYRPAANIGFAVRSNALFGIVIITSAGLVIPNVGSNVNFEVSCSFIAEQ